MRSEKEMMDLIIRKAMQDERIRAVYMNGSRTNPNAPKDIFQDYDIVYVVRETRSFYGDEGWIDCFGERLYMQLPEKMDKMRGRKYHWEDTYGYLIQLKDGNRLDLHVSSIEFAQRDILTDRLCRILLDKDKLLPEMPEPTDEDHYVKRPLREDFLCDCNNFWWCMNNVAKGLWREDIPYVMDMLNSEIRPHLVHMLSWWIGSQNGFSCSVGKSGKYMYRYLPEEVWQAFLSTYSDANCENIWRAVFTMCDLFDSFARKVSDGLSFNYNTEEAEASTEHLKHVYRLPKDSTQVY